MGALGGWWAILGVSTLVHAQDVDMSWSLAIDGAPAGTREISVRQVGPGVRVLESWTEVRAVPRRDEGGWSRFLPWRWFRSAPEPQPVYQHRVTASRQGSAPPAFHSVVGGEGPRAEVQGRQIGNVWRVAITDPDGPREGTLRADQIRFTTLDLFDPTVDWRAEVPDEGLDASLLDVTTGVVLDGSLVPIGASEIPVGGEATWVEGWEWRTGAEPWRLFYASNGFLVRFEGTFAERRVQANLDGALPRTSDDFGVPLAPSVEVIEAMP